MIKKIPNRKKVNLKISDVDFSSGISKLNGFCELKCIISKILINFNNKYNNYRYYNA
ncbi:hypothetical protein A8975_0994 [Meridianimaribacter flavus]|jgi:hypothetical protein|uniref:Uncharacterized protein n=1 Tax=Meridianimaribacter flavus TaxID=571115 RepID=A0ABY2G6G7_9FLAO|nr:hypothetical protein A8975_0994 [Meridianimaribacter flavus]